MKIVVIGGTGLIGSKTVAILCQGGYEVIAASPNSGVNTTTGEGSKRPLPARRSSSTLPIRLHSRTRRCSSSSKPPATTFSRRKSPRASGIINEIVAHYLRAVGDPREVVRDPEARYYGGRAEERSLVPLGEACLGHIGFDEWLRRSQTKA